MNNPFCLFISCVTFFLLTFVSGIDAYCQLPSVSGPGTQTEIERLNQRYLYLFNELIDVKDAMDEQSRRLNQLSPASGVRRADIEQLQSRLQQLEMSSIDTSITAELNRMSEDILLLKNQLETIPSNEEPTASNSLTNLLILLLIITLSGLVYFMFKSFNIQGEKQVNNEFEERQPLQQPVQPVYQQELFSQPQPETEPEQRSPDTKPKAEPEHKNNNVYTEPEKYDQNFAEKPVYHRQEPIPYQDQETERVKRVKVLSENLKDEIAMDLLYKEAELLILKIKDENTSNAAKERLEASFNDIFHKIVELKEKSGVS